MIVIDVKKINGVGITINEAIHLYKIRDDTLQYNEFVNYKKLEKLNLIKIINDNGVEKYIIRELGNNLLDEMLEQQKKSLKRTKKLSKRYVSKEVEENVKEYREKWRGLTLGSMGDRQSCKEKLTRWINNNPEYNMQDIMKAADIYLGDIKDLRFLQRADYFIYKKDGKTESSRLSAFIEEINTKQVKSGWSSALN